ncbi:MAG: hypothetical protein K9J82_19625 [Methylotenera sp.]|jgi:hypothetical protein|nr:hypothetical protein [Methylotenera sp.]
MTPSLHTLARWAAPAALALAALAAAPAAQATDVGVSIGFSQPGVYGRVDIGRYPAPVLVAPQPVVIGRPVVREPVYLWVPPGHRRDWRHHCRQYGACGAPVYFVQDGWYREHVIVRRDGPPHRHDHHGHGHGHGHGRGHGPR